MKVVLLTAVSLFGALGCGRVKPGDGVDEPLTLPASCADNAALPPRSLVCTGLYSDVAAKVAAPGVLPFAPAVVLWSDGAEKQRWIELPAGTAIDNTNPNEWIFPVGTKVWKEFSWGGGRVETRLWQKVNAGYWVFGTYVWNADESAAELSSGGDITLSDGTLYHVPTPDECQKCHRGRTDRILGFDQVLLGLPGAHGVTLDTLTQNGQLTVPPASTTLAIGDDGTGAAAPALGWLHVNCGTTCHNENSSSMAYSSGMRLRLDATLLDGRSTADFDQVTSTVGVTVRAIDWSGEVRIVPGSPEQSLLYQLISHRGLGMQMPPIATKVVDYENIALVAAWIAGMPAPLVP